MKYVLLRPRTRGGVVAGIGDSDTDKNSLGEWIAERLLPLPHIPYDGKKMFHSTDGFNTGYNGSGPTDLALAICHLFQKDTVHIKFREQVIALLNPHKAYDMSFDSLRITISQIENGTFHA